MVVVIKNREISKWKPHRNLCSFIHGNRPASTDTNIFSKHPGTVSFCFTILFCFPYKYTFLLCVHTRVSVCVCRQVCAQYLHHLLFLVLVCVLSAWLGWATSNLHAAFTWILGWKLGSPCWHSKDFTSHTISLALFIPFSLKI